MRLIGQAPTHSLSAWQPPAGLKALAVPGKCRLTGQTGRKEWPDFRYFLLLFSVATCKMPYTPPAIKTNNQFLVVAGFIVNGTDSTYITLSHSRNLVDTAPSPPELGAQIYVVGKLGETFQLAELGQGIYGGGPFALDPGDQYQLKIITGSGGLYESDFVPVKNSPPIDSLHFRLDSTGATIYVNTHDPTGNTQYYQWNYVQTWEHRSFYGSLNYYDFNIMSVSLRDSAQMVNRCWTTKASNSILLANSSGLNEDLIYEAPLLTIPLGSEQISFEYSISVSQFALTSQGYQFWSTLKANTEETGGLFDPQPSQTSGNIHCISNPSETVIGYVSAGGISHTRILINPSQLSYWPYEPIQGCYLFSVPASQVSSTFSDTTLYIPIETLLFGAVSGSYRYCGDCRAQGGGTAKPAYWPN
jgi:hypothetical protein